MDIALISIGNCPSLANRNLRRYCLSQPDIADGVHFHLFDYDWKVFVETRSQSALRWSFVTGYDATLRDLLALRPALVGFSCYLWNTETSLRLGHLIKQALPETTLVLGGPDVGPRAQELLHRHPFVDVIVEGDGELPLLGLVRHHLNGAPAWDAIPGLRFQDTSGFVEAEPAKEQVDMAHLKGVWDPPPTPELMEGWEWPYVLYETLRGCPYACSYCMYGKTPLNAKDPDLVVRELVELLQAGRSVELIDPTFTTYVKRAKQILRGLVEHAYDGTLTFEAYPDSLDEEMVELMAKARVSFVGIGFQTLSADGLKAVKRPKNLPRFERAVRLLREYNIRYYVDLIYGLPRTTKQDFYATVDYLYDLEVESLTVYRLLGLPGSPMMDDAEEHGLVFNQLPPYEMLYSNTFSHDDVMECEAFQGAYTNLMGGLPTAAGRRLAKTHGGVSRLVLRYLGEEHETPEAFRAALRLAGEWPEDLAVA